MFDGRTQSLSSFPKISMPGRIFLCVAMAVFLMACRNDEADPIIKNIFQITIEADVIKSTDQEDWIIIHDLNGNIVDYKKLQTGTANTFDAYSTLINNQLSITHLSYNKTNYASKEQYNYSFKTYQNINLYEDWTLKKPILKTRFCPSPTSQANINLTGISAEIRKEFSITNNCGSQASSGTLYANGTYEGKLSFIENENLLIRYIDKNGVLHYKFLYNLQNQSSFGFDLNSFDQAALVVTPEVTGAIYFLGVVNGFENSQEIDDTFGSITGYNLFSSWGSDLTNVKFSYISNLNRYYSLFNISYLEKSVKYYKIGTPIISLSKPIENFAITNRFIDNFSFNSTNTCKFYKSTFEYLDLNNITQIRIGWEIRNKETMKRTPVTKIPDEILNKHPGLKNATNATLNHKSSEFVIKSSMDYYEQIALLYKELIPKPTDEIIIIYP